MVGCLVQDVFVGVDQEGSAEALVGGVGVVSGSPMLRIEGLERQPGKGKL